ncbi:MAG TPA: alpha/beta fold hydrolase [Anaerolineae bacterium]|nr:alpha/beta fold hydrolase [Anaerolineae bacterium]
MLTVKQRSLWGALAVGVVGAAVAWRKWREEDEGADTDVVAQQETLLKDVKGIIEPFNPPSWLRNKHVQTMGAYYTRASSGVEFARERIELADGDFIDIDFADVGAVSWSQMAADSPIMLLLHGLEGSARRPYSYELYRQISEHGIRVVGINYRSCSGVMNRKVSTYHAGLTGDVQAVVDYLRGRWPQAPLGLVGVSLGANLLLKYLGELGEDGRQWIQGAVAISPPFDLDACSAHMAEHARLYQWNIMRSLLEKLEMKQAVFGEAITAEPINEIRTLREFDELVTAPLNGFKDAADYYEQMGAKRYLANIEVPTLLIRAEDDPFFANDIPYRTIKQNPNLRAIITPHGGHVGFWEAGVWRRRYWSERQAGKFLATFLKGE